MCALCCINTTTLLTLRIINDDTTLTTLDENNEEGYCKHQYCNQQQQEEVQVALPRLLDSMGHCRREPRYNTREDNDRDTVADTAFSNLLTQPHQEHCPGYQAHNRSKVECKAWI